LRKPSSVRPQLDDAAQDVEYRRNQLVDHALTDGAAAAFLQRTGSAGFYDTMRAPSQTRQLPACDVDRV
jgi:hypothetical protein